MATAHAPGFPFLILSAERVENTAEENAVNTELMAAYLSREGLTYDRCLGQYDGTREVSFRVCLNVDDAEGSVHAIDVVRKLAAGFRQECVLAVRADGYAALVYEHDDAQHIGWWSRCEESDLQGERPDFTLIDGEHFIVEVAS